MDLYKDKDLRQRIEDVDKERTEVRVRKQVMTDKVKPEGSRSSLEVRVRKQASGPQSPLLTLDRSSGSLVHMLALHSLQETVL